MNWKHEVDHLGIANVEWTRYTHNSHHFRFVWSWDQFDPSNILPMNITFYFHAKLDQNFSSGHLFLLILSLLPLTNIPISTALKIREEAIAFGLTSFSQSGDCDSIHTYHVTQRTRIRPSSAAPKERSRAMRDFWPTTIYYAPVSYFKDLLVKMHSKA